MGTQMDPQKLQKFEITFRLLNTIHDQERLTFVNKFKYIIKTFLYNNNTEYSFLNEYRVLDDDKSSIDMQTHNAINCILSICMDNGKNGYVVPAELRDIIIEQFKLNVAFTSGTTTQRIQTFASLLKSLVQYNQHIVLIYGNVNILHNHICTLQDILGEGNLHSGDCHNLLNIPCVVENIDEWSKTMTELNQHDDKKYILQLFENL